VQLYASAAADAVLEGKAAAPSAANVREEEFADADGEKKGGQRRAPAKKAAGKSEAPAKKADAEAPAAVEAPAAEAPAVDAAEAPAAE